MLQKTDVEGLARDTETRAILNTDRDGLNAYKLQKQKAREFEAMKIRLEKIDKIDKEIDNINDKLHQILERLNAGFSSKY